MLAYPWRAYRSARAFEIGLRRVSMFGGLEIRSSIPRVYSPCIVIGRVRRPDMACVSAMVASPLMQR